jgi:hypothetical protein
MPDNPFVVPMPGQFPAGGQPPPMPGQPRLLRPEDFAPGRRGLFGPAEPPAPAQAGAERPLTREQFAELSLPGAAEKPPAPAAAPAPGAIKGAPPPMPAEYPAGAGKGLPPPMPSAVGQAALADQQAAGAALARRLGELAPPPSPTEQLFAQRPAAIMELHGHPASGGYAQTVVLGPGGGVATTLPGLVDRDALDDLAARYRYAREEEQRKALAGAAIQGANQYPQLYQSQAAMEDAKLRGMMELGPWKQAREVGTAVTAQGMQTHGDRDRAIREGQEAERAMLQALGASAPPPFMQGLLPGGQTTTPEQALAKTMPGGQPQPQGGQNPPLPVGGITDQAAMKYLQDEGVLNEKGQSRGAEIDAMTLAAALAKNPDLAARGRDAFVRTLLAAGVPPDKVNLALQRGLIRLHNEATGGAYEGNYPPYTVKVGGSTPTSKAALPYGFAIEGPDGSGVFHPATWWNAHNFYDTISTRREATKRQYANQAGALAPLMRAIEQEVARRAAAQGAAPPPR